MNIVEQFIVNGEVVNVPDNTEQINTLEQKVDSNTELINANSERINANSELINVNSVLITDHELRIKQLEDSSSEVEVLIDITYTDLLSLRNLSKLIPGTQYRITDYVTTSTEAETQVAGHLFDIIVTADAPNILNENARAAHHEGDTYFANSKLEAWTLKYCLDNDTDRFGWADETNGKGVIYRLTDERGNSCPYDFKNIKLKFRPSAAQGVLAAECVYTFSIGAVGNNSDADRNFGDIDFSMSDIYYVYNNYIGDNHFRMYHTDQYKTSLGWAQGQGCASGYVDGCIYTDQLQLPFILFVGPMIANSYVCGNSCDILITASNNVNKPDVSYNHHQNIVILIPKRRATYELNGVSSSVITS